MSYQTTVLKGDLVQNVHKNTDFLGKSKDKKPMKSNKFKRYTLSIKRTNRDQFLYSSFGEAFSG